MRNAIAGAILATALLCPSAQAAGIWGVAPDLGGAVAAHASIDRFESSRATAAQANLPYDGGPVLHSNRTHVIFWEPSGSGLTFDPGYQQLIETFLSGVAADSHLPSNVYGLSGQYTDSSGPAQYASSYGGAVLDTDRLPSNGCVEPPVTGPGWNVCLSNSQLQGEIEHVVAADHLPTTPTDVYFLVTPNGLGSCTDSTSTSCALGGSVSGYCGYHSITADGEVLYAVIPYNAVPGHCQSGNPRPNSSTADPAISTISHEHNELVTDPDGDAWIDSSGNEDGDLCITTFGPDIGGSGPTAWNESIHGGHYFLQEEWSNEDNGCEPRDESDQVSFTTSATRRGTRFSASARDPDGSIASLSWTFGDGAGGRGRTVVHAFKHSGSYRVTLRSTDSAGNWAFYTRAISVAAARDRRRPSPKRSPAPTKSG